MSSIRCQECNEIIPCPTPRYAGNVLYYLCSECAHEPLGHNAGRTYPAEATDMAYHGGMFNRGEF